MTKLTIADIQSMDEARLARLSREELMEFALGTLKTTRVLADQLEREATGRPALTGFSRQADGRPSGDNQTFGEQNQEAPRRMTRERPAAYAAAGILGNSAPLRAAAMRSRP
jgi:hypothetical protein